MNPSSAVTIGNAAVIGAASVVPQAVSRYGVASGIPGRLLRMRFAQHLAERL